VFEKPTSAVRNTEKGSAITPDEKTIDRLAYLQRNF